MQSLKIMMAAQVSILRTNLVGKLFYSKPSIWATSLLQYSILLFEM